MKTDHPYYDAAVAGGGLAGLAAAICLRKRGFRVILFEKEQYPFHKVCGEYISMESYAFLQSLGVPLDEWRLPLVTRLLLTAPDGAALRQDLPLGGFGVSRYRIDQCLAALAASAGVDVCSATKVQDVLFDDDRFTIITDRMTVSAKVCCGAFGKRSNLDIKWQRGFIQKRSSALNNYIGVKYHAVLDHPADLIALHNFPGGYCGIAPIEEGRVNICYLTTAQALRDHGNDIGALEKNLLSANPFLKSVFSEASFLQDRPLTISQISFDKKEQVANHVLMLGDAAGLITPLCGNGMSMALHAARIATTHITRYLDHQIDRAALESGYTRDWQRHFAPRLRAGRLLQSLFARPRLTAGVLSLLRPFPWITRSIIRKTHG